MAEEKESVKVKINELCRRAFSTKAYKDKIDRKHEMFLMVHMAKADGVIEEQEKKYLAQTITGLHGFTNKEKAELFGLMSTSTLPTITPLNAYFSTKERAEEARKKIVELVAKADGVYEPEEKTKLEEINKAIEGGFKAKPSGIGQFFKTWQVSLSILLIIASLSFLAYNVIVILPLKNAERKAKLAEELKNNNIEAEKLLSKATSIDNTNKSEVSNEGDKSKTEVVNESNLNSEITAVVIGKWEGEMSGKNSQ